MNQTSVQPGPSESEIDAILADSFPASDPPSWTLGIEPQTEHASFSRQKEGDEMSEHRFESLVPSATMAAPKQPLL